MIRVSTSADDRRGAGAGLAAPAFAGAVAAPVGGVAGEGGVPLLEGVAADGTDGAGDRVADAAVLGRGEAGDRFGPERPLVARNGNVVWPGVVVILLARSGRRASWR
jgi:hypothetical protein